MLPSNCAFSINFIVKLTCNGYSDQTVVYFESPGYPSPFSSELSCSAAIVLKRATQRLLLEFEFFELLPPIDGNCATDKFVISGQNPNKHLPVLCGVNTGQHCKYF